MMNWLRSLCCSWCSQVIRENARLRRENAVLLDELKALAKVVSSLTGETF